MTPLHIRNVAATALLSAALCLLVPNSVLAAPDQGLEIIKAEWGAFRQRTVDVTARVRSLVRNDRLDMKATAEALGVTQPPRGMLVISYRLNGRERTTSFGNGQDVWIAALPRIEAARIDEFPELRRKQPQGLIIVVATFGANDHTMKDVTDVLRQAMSGDSLTLPVRVEVLGDPAVGSIKTLKVTYSPAGSELKTVTQDEGTTLQIGERTTTLIGPDGQLVNVSARIEELRRQRPTGLLIINARYGEGNRWHDVTEMVQKAVVGDSLTVPIGDETFGNPAPGAAEKVFQLAYISSDGQARSVEQPQASTLQIGPRRTAIVAFKGGLLNLADRLTELRKTHPQGLAIIAARFGTHNRWVDVTDKLQAVVKGDVLQIQVGSEEFGDPAPGQSKVLQTTYHDERTFATVSTVEGATQRITPESAAIIDDGGLVLRPEDRVAPLAKVYGDGLLILDAQYGSGNRWGDIRELLQHLVVENTNLNANIGENWPDTAPGSTKDVKVVYWDGAKVRDVTLGGGKLELRGALPEAVNALKPLPKIIAQGSELSHVFGASGDTEFSLLDGPQGARLTSRGELKWTPAPDQLGVQRLRIALSSGGRSYTYAANIEVIDQEVARSIGGAATDLAATMRLELGDTPCVYTLGARSESAMVLRPRELIITNPDGITVRRRAPLEAEYARIFERDAHFVALSLAKKRIDLLDKRSLKPLRSIRLPYKDLSDLVIHPAAPMSYAAVEQAPGEGPRYRIIVIDETDGSVREPRNAVGTYLAIAPDGRHLYAGYKDFYQKGIELFMNPDGRIWDTPRYGTIDILMVYDLRDRARPRLAHYKEEAGANGAGIRLSPDGQLLSYLSAGGYSTGSGTAVPAWDPDDLEKLPVMYDPQGRAASTKLTYHPSLPIAAMPGRGGPVFFDRATGDEQTSRVRLPESVLQNAQIDDVSFSPDGLHAILHCCRGGQWWLYRAPLVLSPEERVKAQRRPAVPRPPARENNARPAPPRDRA